MLIIQHRVNLTKFLNRVNKSRGVEIDLRSYNSKLVVEHEPFIESVCFERWLDSFHHKFLIANIKEERLEFEVIRI